jgi:4-amino-4-deoxy-L-arabinose transferase-like glycosyltransferase
MKSPEQTSSPDPSGQNKNAPRFAGGSLPIVWVTVVLCVAAVLRFVNLGQLSFWYDEVVPMRLARAGSPAEMIDLLFKIEATRAPLHPLLLEAWVAIFGQSELAGRSLSAVFGVLTVLVIFDLGRKLFDNGTGLWAAWFSAISPLLVFYSREAKMYSWLVLLSCLAWRQLVALHDRSPAVSIAVYVMISAALAYTQPLGLFMVATLASAGWLWRRSLFGGVRRWLLTQIAIAAIVIPWCRYYLDHPPEFLSGPLPLRFLLGTPIAFIGGNFISLGLVALLISFGIYGWTTHPDDDPHAAIRKHWRSFGCLLLWLIIPPTALYAYSRAFQPIFGPARYSVYAAPPFFLLIGAALSRLKPRYCLPVAACLTIIAIWSLVPTVYAPDQKADWRAFAHFLATQAPGPSGRSTGIIVASTNPDRNVEVETARYYLPPGVLTLPLDSHTDKDPSLANISRLFLAVGTSASNPQPREVPASLGPFRFGDYVEYPGLRIYEGFR